MELRYDSAPALTAADQPDSTEREDALLARLQHATEQRDAAERAMHLSEIRYRRLFETSADSIIIVDGQDCIILDTNQAAQRLLGLSKIAARGHPLSALSPFTAILDMDQRLRSLVTRQVTHQEIALPQANGFTTQHLDIVATVYREQDRDVVQLSIRDITDRKNTLRLEAEAADLIAERQELLNLNLAKDEFISVASHQLRTPATAVKQYMGILLQGFVGRITRDQRRTLERAFASNERQLKIINDLLLVARVDAGKIVLNKEPTDVVALIKDVAAEQQPILERRSQQLTLEVPRSLKACIDARFIRMVLENLLSNASKYSPERAPITIIVRRNRSCCSIAVVDRGIGISEADQPKLYRKFSRIYNEQAVSVEGTGLGLYWAKKIIELHCGTVSVTSQLHAGSTFTLCLPLS